MTIPTPNGFTGDMFFEELLRRFLAFQLKELTRNVNDPNVTFVDELFGRLGDNTRLQVKKWLAEHPNIEVVINYPREDLKLPFIAVVNAEENEKTNEAYLGDDGGWVNIGGRSVEAPDTIQGTPNLFGETIAQPDPRPRATHARQLLSIPESHVTRLYIGTEDVNLTMYLYAIVKALLIVNKLDFDRYVGARNMKINGSDFEHRPEMFPTFAYFKMITLAYDINFDIPLSPVRTIGGVTVSLEAYLQGEA